MLNITLVQVKMFHFSRKSDARQLNVLLNKRLPLGSLLLGGTIIF